MNKKPPPQQRKGAPGKKKKEIPKRTKKNEIFFPPFPHGKKFDVVYADPPWHYKNAKTPYHTVQTKHLVNLPVWEICATDCLLFMWTTGPKFPDALLLGHAWGFVYITIAFVWDKQRTTNGVYTLPQCEMCLLFRRGSAPAQGVRNTRQLLSVQRTRHSEKPAEVRRSIAEMFPAVRRIELFARCNSAPNCGVWSFWGNETDKT